MPDAGGKDNTDSGPVASNNKERGRTSRGNTLIFDTRWAVLGVLLLRVKESANEWEMYGCARQRCGAGHTGNVEIVKRNVAAWFRRPKCHVGLARDTSEPRVSDATELRTSSTSSS